MLRLLDPTRAQRPSVTGLRRASSSRPLNTRTPASSSGDSLSATSFARSAIAGAQTHVDATAPRRAMPGYCWRKPDEVGIEIHSERQPARQSAGRGGTCRLRQRRHDAHVGGVFSRWCRQRRCRQRRAVGPRCRRMRARTRAPPARARRPRCRARRKATALVAERRAPMQMPPRRRRIDHQQLGKDRG
jgi:hypothetical protein